MNAYGMRGLTCYYGGTGKPGSLGIDVGEIYRPGQPPRPPLPPQPSPRLPVAPRPQRVVVLQCMLCGRVFHDPVEALAHQLEHEARGEKPCFRIVEVR